MTTDELITNASPKQLREALRKAMAMGGVSIMDGYDAYADVWNDCVQEFRYVITNALEGKE